MNTQQIRQRFLRDTTEHQMTIARDDGIYRHLIFKQPGSNMYRFELITWPGYLCYTGDMGSYVFTRTHDMLTFFRKKSVDSSIDFRYWAEKVESQDKHSGVQEFSHALFRQSVRQRVRSFTHDVLNDVREEDDNRKLAAIAAVRELRAAVLQAVLQCDDNEVRAYDAMNEFAFHSKAYEYDTDKWAQYFGDTRRFSFDDCWDDGFNDFTLRFAWCFRALVWGIVQYDAVKLEQRANADGELAAECAQ